MIRFIILFAVCHSGWNAELTGCIDDSHCSTDFYCEANVYFCRQCLRCEDFKRAPPVTPVACVKSVVNCGPCIDVKYNGKSGDSSVDCVTNVKNNKIFDRGSKEIRLPVYAWVLIVIILAVILTVGLLIKTSINKITYSLVCRADGQTTRSLSSRGDLPATAPEPPPAYNALYTNLEASSPMLDHSKIDEEAAMCIKPIGRLQPREDREPADRQSAVPYTNPVYVRSAAQPNSNIPPTNEAAAPGPIVLNNHPEITPNSDTDERSVVDGLSGDANIAVAPEDASTTSTAVAMESCLNAESTQPAHNQTAYVGSTSATEHHASPVIVVNNIVNLQAVSSSEANSYYA